MDGVPADQGGAVMTTTCAVTVRMTCDNPDHPAGRHESSFGGATRADALSYALTRGWQERTIRANGIDTVLHWCPACVSMAKRLA